MLRVPLLASGHRPGIYFSIARRAALEGSALLLLLLLYTDWPQNQPLVDLPKLTANLALELAPAQLNSLQRLLCSSGTGRGGALIGVRCQSNCAPPVYSGCSEG